MSSTWSLAEYSSQSDQKAHNMDIIRKEKETIEEAES